MKVKILYKYAQVDGRQFVEYFDCYDFWVNDGWVGFTNIHEGKFLTEKIIRSDEITSVERVHEKT